MQLAGAAHVYAARMNDHAGQRGSPSAVFSVMASEASAARAIILPTRKPVRDSFAPLWYEGLWVFDVVDNA